MTPFVDSPLLAEQVTAFLISPYKPLLMFLTFLPWAWLVADRLDKDAAYFHFKRTQWNAVHLAAGVAALVAMLFIPIFWISWPVGIILLLGPILVYWRHRNANVPEAERFHLSAESLSARMERRRQSRADRNAVLQFTGPGGELREVPQSENPAYGMHMLVEDLLAPALDARAEIVEINVSKNGAQPMQVVDGIRYKREPMSAEAGMQAIDYIKRMAGLDVEDRRRRQSAKFGMRGPNGTSELNVTTAGSSSGVVLKLEFNRARRLNKPFDELGMLPSQAEALRFLLEPADRHGVVLIGAPTGQGLSTSCYAFLRRHDAYTSNIKSLEREVELRIDGVDHVQWDANAPEADYATALQSMLRRDPDVVMSSYVKDAETARVIAEQGLEGPLIYVPQRADSIVEQIREWTRVVGDVKKATRSLQAVINQRLLRRLCPNCRQGFQPTAEQVKKLGLPSGKVQQLHRASGKVQVKNKIENCPVCGGSGYIGQVGVYEVLTLDREARKLLAAGDLKAVLANARRNKMIYMQEAALSKVVSGDTTLEEVARVIASGSGGGKSRGSAPARKAS